MKLITLKEAITGSLRQANIDHDKIDNFRKQLRIYLRKVDEYSNESGEETYQRDFFQNTFYANNDIRHLIITNMYEYFVFDADDFYKYFYKNHELRKQFIEFRESLKSGNNRRNGKTTKDFYPVIGNYIERIQSEIPFVYLNLDTPKYRSAANSENDFGLNGLKSIYKLFSDSFMLKKRISEDRNALNNEFYSELLYILGLKEVKKDRQLVITRLDESVTNRASLMDIIEKIVKERLPLREEYNKYGDTLEERTYEASLEICINWINRLLFLKLLESQLIKYHDGDKQYKILDWTKINSFQSLDNLFFDVLAVDYDKRCYKDILELLRNVPYLNSSLFERTKEDQNEYTVDKAKAIDEKIFDVYGLSREERDAIGFIDFHNNR